MILQGWKEQETNMTYGTRNLKGCNPCNIAGCDIGSLISKKVGQKLGELLKLWEPNLTNVRFLWQSKVQERELTQSSRFCTILFATDQLKWVCPYRVAQYCWRILGQDSVFITALIRFAQLILTPSLDVIHVPNPVAVFTRLAWSDSVSVLRPSMMRSSKTPSLSTMAWSRRLARNKTISSLLSLSLSYTSTAHNSSCYLSVNL